MANNQLNSKFTQFVNRKVKILGTGLSNFSIHLSVISLIFVPGNRVDPAKFTDKCMEN